MLRITGSFPGVIHYQHGSAVFGTIKNRIYLSEDGGVNWKEILQIPLFPAWRVATATGLGERLTRGGIRHLYPVGDSLMIMGYGSIYTFDLGTGKLRRSAHPMGSRPLNVCAVSGILYYGEYGDNPQRHPVNIYRSGDAGLTWKSVCQFNNVRHIHGVFYDEFTRSFWVATGDQDEESALWVTEDEFSSIHKVLHGSQQFRAVTLLFTKEFLYFGSDTGREANYLYRYSKTTGQVEKLQRVGSSVFYGCKVGDNLLFSTVCEPSKINDTDNLAIWHSSTGESWLPVFTFGKDLWPKKLFQYGQIRFSAGEGLPGELWFSGLALRGITGSIKLDLVD